ncbi:MAG TPA: MraY family glycosyltransferase [Patescibacteria group bacterium]|jgi:UDP-GlcNAc:undecaprenyl-phosphate GlcNAc-1-phosphate transferase
MAILTYAFLLTFAAAAALTPWVGRFALKSGIVDHPGGRRIHRKVTPRLGGAAVMAAFFIGFLVFLPQLSPNFRPGQLLIFSLTALFLLAVGFVDDKRGLPPAVQLLSHAVAGVSLAAAGMAIEEVTNPFGGKVALDQLQVAMPFDAGGRMLNLPADLITVVWVVLVINAVNWLDGLDGLAAGVGGIAAVTVALLSLSAVVGQPHVALLALLLAGSIGGFLVYNFHPAKIFLGTVGSTFIGYVLATLAVISGGKIATAFLVLGFPILDATTIILRRIATGAPPWKPDTRHLHHLLLKRGFSVRKTVLFLYGVSAVFGLTALIAGTTGRKVLMAAVLAVMLAALLVWLARPVAKSAK